MTLTSPQILLDYNITTGACNHEKMTSYTESVSKLLVILLLLTSVTKQWMTSYSEMQNLAKKKRVMVCLFKPLGFNVYRLGQSLRRIKNHSCWCCKFMELEKIPGFPGFPWDYLFENQLARSFLVLTVTLVYFKTKNEKLFRALQRVLRSLAS